MSYSYLNKARVEEYVKNLLLFEAEIFLVSKCLVQETCATPFTNS